MLEVSEQPDSLTPLFSQQTEPWIMTTVLAVLLLIFIVFRGRIFRQETPPGSLGWPLIGETLELLSCQKRGKPAGFFERRVKKYGRVFKTSLLGNPTVVFYGQEGQRFLFSNENKLVNISWPYSVAIMFRKSVLSKTGDEATRLKRIFLTFLRPEALQTFVGTVDSMAKLHLANYWADRDQVTVLPLMQRLTFCIACSLLVGINSEEDQERLLELFKQMEKGLLQLPINIPGTRFHKAKLARDAILARIGELLQERKKILQKGGACSAASQDLLSCLISGNADENGRGLTDEEIKDNILFLLFAGHETSTSVLTSLIKLLGDNPDCYQKVLREQLAIANLKEKGEVLKWKDMQKMKYTWQCVQETMRLYPPGLGGFRKVIKDFTYNGFKIPKGWKAFWSTYSTQMNAEYFKDPEKFDPDRFEGDGPAPYTYVPFGGGVRVCPGMEFARMEILVFLHNLVTMFKWKHVDPSEKMIVDPVPIPAFGLLIKPRSLAL